MFIQGKVQDALLLPITIVTCYVQLSMKVLVPQQM